MQTQNTIQEEPQKTFTFRLGLTVPKLKQNAIDALTLNATRIGVDTNKKIITIEIKQKISAMIGDHVATLIRLLEKNTSSLTVMFINDEGSSEHHTLFNDIKMSSHRSEADYLNYEIDTHLIALSYKDSEDFSYFGQPKTIDELGF